MRYKLFDAEGVPIGCTVHAGLLPAFQLPMEPGCLEGPFASLVIHFWEQQAGAFCSQDVAGCVCFVRTKKPYEGFCVCFVVDQC